MTSPLDEVKRNLRIVGQLDLADAMVSEDVVAREPRILEYTRYLIALNGCRSHYAMGVRAEIVAALWTYTDSYSDEENLRVIIFICVEQLVRECSDIESIHDQLMALAAAYEASSGGSADLRKVTQMVGLRDFSGIRGFLPPPKACGVVNVFGRARRYFKYGDMDSAAFDGALEEAEPWFSPAAQK